MGKMALQRNAKLFATDERFCIDNGAMIAHAGLEMFSSSLSCSVSVESSGCSQRFRTDQMEAFWRN